ncbi:MAG TPA: hypothetical protein GX011_06015 [Clostridiales bacterium]|nr:hypothetical protein [Clostridiales bacterium]
MTNRERALNILRYRPIDRLPAVHFGYWRELLYEWAAQGKITQEMAAKCRDSNAYDRELDRIIGWDFNWSHTYGPSRRLLPEFEHKVLEVLPDGTKRVQNGYGVIEKVRPGVVSIPAEDDYQLRDREAFERLYKPKMRFTPERVRYDFFRSFNENVYEKLDVPVGISVGSVLGDIRNMTSVIGLSYLMYDEDEDLLADIIDTYAEMQYKCVEEVLKTGAKFDFAHYWEDICYNGGPLISPVVFDRLCRKHYERRCALLRQYGIDLVSLDCDGVVDKLLPTWFESGVNIMFPIEVGTWGDQFEAARKKYGPGMLGVGGMNKVALCADKAAVDAEIERMRRLAALGGFIPCPDHRLMPGTKFELVQYYAEEIKKIRI